MFIISTIIGVKCSLANTEKSKYGTKKFSPARSKLRSFSGDTNISTENRYLSFMQP